MNTANCDKLISENRLSVRGGIELCKERFIAVKKAGKAKMLDSGTEVVNRKEIVEPQDAILLEIYNQEKFRALFDKTLLKNNQPVKYV